LKSAPMVGEFDMKKLEGQKGAKKALGRVGNSYLQMKYSFD